MTKRTAPVEERTKSQQTGELDSSPSLASNQQSVVGKSLPFSGASYPSQADRWDVDLVGLGPRSPLHQAASYQDNACVFQEADLASCWCGPGSHLNTYITKTV